MIVSFIISCVILKLWFYFFWNIIYGIVVRPDWRSISLESTCICFCLVPEGTYMESLTNKFSAWKFWLTASDQMRTSLWVWILKRDFFFFPSNAKSQQTSFFLIFFPIVNLFLFYFIPLAKCNWAQQAFDETVLLSSTLNLNKHMPFGQAIFSSVFLFCIY